MYIKRTGGGLIGKVVLISMHHFALGQLGWSVQVMEEPETNISPDFCTVILTSAAGFTSGCSEISSTVGVYAVAVGRQAAGRVAKTSVSTPVASPKHWESPGAHWTVPARWTVLPTTLHCAHILC